MSQAVSITKPQASQGCTVKNLSPGVVAHAYNPSNWEAKAGRFEFKANLVCRVSSRTARNTQRNPVLKNKTKQTNKQTKKKDIVEWCCNVRIAP